MWLMCTSQTLFLQLRLVSYWPRPMGGQSLALWVWVNTRQNWGLHHPFKVLSKYFAEWALRCHGWFFRSLESLPSPLVLWGDKPCLCEANWSTLRVRWILNYVVSGKPHTWSLIRSSRCCLKRHPGLYMSRMLKPLCVCLLVRNVLGLVCFTVSIP